MIRPERWHRNWSHFLKRKSNISRSIYEYGYRGDTWKIILFFTVSNLSFLHAQKRESTTM